MKIRGYEIIRETGVGDLARVFEAVHEETGTPVSVQQLHAELFADPAMREVFLQEMRRLVTLDHPGLVKIREVGVDEQGRVYIVQDPLSGLSTAEDIARRGPIPEAEALSWANEVAEALDYAWIRLRLPHAHLHPGVIRIDSEGTIRVAELGFSRLVARLSASSAAPERTLPRGTQHYLSPEQFDALAALDARSDICSLGLVLFYWLTAHLPFSESWDKNLAEEMKTGQLPALRTLRPESSPAVEQLLSVMTDRNRIRRYPNWNNVLKDIAAVQGGRRLSYTPGPDSLIPPPHPTSLNSAPVQTAAAPSPARRVVLSKTDRQKLRQTQPRKSSPGVIRVLLVWLLLAGAGVYVFHWHLGLTWDDLVKPQGNKADLPRTLTEADLPQGTKPYREASPRTVEAPRVRVSRIEIPDAATKPDEAIKTLDPLFLRGAQRFNEGLELYKEYQQARSDPTLLKRIEETIEAALQDFSAYRKAHPNHPEVTRYIEQCYGMIRYARQSFLTDHGLAGAGPSSRETTPEKPALRPRLDRQWRVPHSEEEKQAAGELLRLLNRRGTTEPSASEPADIQLFPGIPYLSPAADAAALFQMPLPEGVLIRHPAFPASSVRLHTLEGTFPEGWTALRLFTDLENQVLAVQGIREAPMEPTLPPVLFSSYWKTYDLGTGLAKPDPDLLVAHRVRSRKERVQIESELAKADPADPSRPGLALSRSTLYLARPVVDLMLARLKALR